MEFSKHLNKQDLLPALTYLPQSLLWELFSFFSVLLSHFISSLLCFLLILFIQPAYTLSQGEDNLLIPVHAYPVIDDLHIPTHIDLPAVALGQRCVCVCFMLVSMMDWFILTSCLPEVLPEVLPVSLYSSMQPAMISFTHWCQVIKK